jgi:hypothetical protein
MTIDEHFAEFASAAEQAFARDNGEAALAGCGFQDVLHEVASSELARAAVFATFRGEGRALGTSAALFHLMAQPYGTATSLGTTPVLALALGRSDGAQCLAVPAGWDREVIVDLPDAGLMRVPVDKLRPTASVVFDPDLLGVAAIIGDGEWLAAADACAEARRRSVSWGELACANEILGAAEACLELTIDHARDRVQFGAPIASFQAVRHLLAWSSLDVQAGRPLCLTALRALDDPCSPQLTLVVKAVAGRNARRVADRCAQVLGGMGFTREHAFHRYHRRIVALDGLLGGSSAAIAALGRGFMEFLPSQLLSLTGQAAAWTEHSPA